MDCRVVVEAAVPVYDVATADEAVRIAISKTGEMLNPDLNYVEIDMSERSCPHCGEVLEPAFLAADESLVALELEMTVFNVERDEHAARIARKEIGQRLTNIPLEVLEIEELADDDDDDDDDNEVEADEDEVVEADEDEVAEPDEDEVAEPDETDDADRRESAPDDDRGSEEIGAADSDRDDDVLPEFEELIDE